MELNYNLKYAIPCSLQMLLTQYGILITQWDANDYIVKTIYKPINYTSAVLRQDTMKL
ncbi:hypothetical protein HORM4_240008 [Vibrio harveyi]|nr:hypothetical protein HORM4_240008 [Vibrio harveyi]